MSIKKVDSKVDFIQEEHNVLDFWKKIKFLTRGVYVMKGNHHGASLMGQLQQIILWEFIMHGAEL